MDENPHIQFDLLGIDKEHWKRTMRKNGEYCDELFLCQAARSLNRNIYVLPFFEEDWHEEMIKTTDNPEPFPTIYVLYYSETRFHNGHYQSIRRIERYIIHFYHWHSSYR